MKEHTKRQYGAPRLSVHGSLEALTKGSTDGSQLDAAFPDNTPRGELTFS